MAKNVKIVATVVPRFLEDENSFKVYLHLTPRLPDKGVLTDYYEIYNWHEQAEVFANEQKFELLEKKGSSWQPIGTLNASIELNGYWGHFDLLDESGKVIDVLQAETPDSKTRSKDIKKEKRELLWRKMFNGDVKVEGWVIDELPYDIAARLGREEVLQSMKEAIDDTIEDVLAGRKTEHFTHDSILSEKEQQTIVEALKSLKKYSRVEDILTDPILYAPQNLIYDVRPDLIRSLQEKLSGLVIAFDREMGDLLLQLNLREIEARNIEETEEFHKKMSSYSNFPFLLKQTGWLWEYKVPIINDAIKFDKSQRLCIRYVTPDSSDPDTKLFLEEIDIKCPLTAIEFDELDGKKLVTYGVKPTVIKPDGREDKFDYMEFINGYLRKESSDHNFTLQPELVEKNQLFDKIKDFVNREYQLNYNTNKAPQDPDIISKQDRISDNLNVEERDRFKVLTTEYSQLNTEKNKYSGKPDFISSGISVKIKNLKTAVENAIKENPKKQSQDINKTPESENADNKDFDDATAFIYNHNLHMGYRVDVFDETRNQEKDRKNSLCRRDVYYYLMVGEKCRCIKDSDEGWVSESVQGSNSRKLYVDAELLRWNDWSLVASKLFKSMENDEAKTDEAEAWITANEKLKICAFPSPHSLPPLRFGHSYKFSLRFVDICGGGPDFNSLPEGDVSEVKTKPQVYERTDPIGAPLIHLHENLHQKGNRKNSWEKKRWGEDLLTIVIRSTVEELQNKSSADISSRIISPPSTHFQFVKKHGVLDCIISDQEKQQNDLTDVSMELLELMSYVLENNNEKQEEDVRKIEDIDYLFDPVINGYELAIDRIVDNWELTSIKPKNGDFSNDKLGYWKDCKYFKINLQHKRNIIDYEIKKDSPFEKTIFLQQGIEKDLYVQATYFDKFKTLLNNAETDLENLFFKKTISVNKTHVKLIHAVQKPCLILTDNPEKYKNCYSGRTTVADRPLLATSSFLRIDFKEFPDLTCESYILYALYADIVCDRECDLEQGFYYNEIKQVVCTGFSPVKGGELNVVFDELQHVFSDTKHRRICYYLEAVSKFKKYFPLPITDFSVFGIQEGHTFNPGTEPWNYKINDSRTCKELQHKPGVSLLNNLNIIPSSNHPEPLAIDRVVPLITTTNSNGSFERSCHTIRVYFDGDWYGSGEDEKVALLFSKKIYDSSNTSRELADFISQFGNDPAAQEQQPNTLSFKINETTINGTPLRDKNEDQLLEIPLSSLDFDNKGAANKDLILHAILIENIQYQKPNRDEGRSKGQFYIDISFRPSCMDELQNLYFPFVRFALARYQPNSISNTPSGLNVHFSKITITDFVQLLPYRKIVVSEKAVEYSSNAVRKDKEQYSKSLLRLIRIKQHQIPESLFDVTDLQDEYLNIEGDFKPVVTSDSSNEIPLKPGVNTITIEARQPGEMLLLEEYEQYEVAGDNSGVKKLYTPTNRNGREDYTKRLILTYKLP